jgi:DNA-binding FadR family transcriptional regulator
MRYFRPSVGEPLALPVGGVTDKIVRREDAGLREQRRDHRDDEADRAQLHARRHQDSMRALESRRPACGNTARFVAADMAFQNAIAAVSRNPIYIAVSQAILQWVFEHYPRILRVPGVEDVT